MKIYRCEICGNILVKLEDVTEALACCGEPMGLLEVQTVEGLGEKHLPVITKDGDKVEVVVGDIIHPMDDNHYINFIILETKNGFQVKYLNPGEEPKAEFITKDEVVAVYEYCNLHGLWKKEI